MFLLKSYPPLALVINAFKSRGARVFLVGGALRDYFLNRQGTDLDFAVDKNAIFLSRQFAKQIKGAFVLLDGEHGSARVVKKIDGVIWTFDFTDWRGKTIQQDLALRDFTINAFALDILDPKASERSVLGMKNSIKDNPNKEKNETNLLKQPHQDN